MRCFLSNKHWKTSDMKKLVNMKKRDFREGDRVFEKYKVTFEAQQCARFVVRDEEDHGPQESRIRLMEVCTKQIGLT